MATNTSGSGARARGGGIHNNLNTDETFTCDLCNSFSSKSMAGVLRHIGKRMHVSVISIIDVYVCL